MEIFKDTSGIRDIEQMQKVGTQVYYRGIDPTPIVGEIKDADEAHEHGVSEEDE